MGRMTAEDFVVTAIVKLRTGKYKGIHNVFSGFNAAFREYFPGADPVETVKAMEAKGLIVTHASKKGAMMYLTSDAPGNKKNISAILAQIVGE